jgi:fatty acid desaturase
MSSSLQDIDADAVERDLTALRDELRSQAGPEDLAHLRRVAVLGRLATLLGWATAWVVPNPLSVVALSLGIMIRWTMIAHHVTHRGYDKVPGVPKRLTSKHFARGWRRIVDWMDIVHPEAWRHEHNTLHHYKLGEVRDPDQPEHNMEWLRTSGLPMPLRYVVVFVGMLTWRWFYYPPNTMKTWYERELRRARRAEEIHILERRVWSPFSRPGRDLWWRCWLPYFTFHFVLLPLPFLALGPWAWASVLANRFVAELVANVHTFTVIVPSHAGDDLFRFEGGISGRKDFYVRQITGSANYRTGGFVNDLLHGWLNYQIEHHLWPDMTMRQYTLAQPRVKEICARHGLPYRQESVFSRLRRLMRVMVGTETMPVVEPRYGPVDPVVDAAHHAVADRPRPTID